MGNIQITTYRGWEICTSSRIYETGTRISRPTEVAAFAHLCQRGDGDDPKLKWRSMRLIPTKGERYFDTHELAHSLLQAEAKRFIDDYLFATRDATPEIIQKWMRK
jgi:hypothetical protein